MKEQFPIIFLDIDGVFNCQLFYTKRKGQPKESEYPLSELCKERIGWFNVLCAETDAKVVISSTWRMGKTVAQLQKIINDVYGTFEIIGVTPILRNENCVRGNEIALWIKENVKELFGIEYYDYNNYVIIDDDSDMLYQQRNNLFLTDNYSGLTPTTCYKVKRFFNNKTFDRVGN